MEKQEYKKSILDYEGVQDAVACAREDGERMGFEEGREEGIMEGIEKGMLRERIHLVKTLFSNGMDVATISKMTGFAQETIEMMIK